ncbi:DUF488 domain-containing protein [Marixanthomonas spongiae]|uniref:DUF488 domain-containing protein n=1 Tax=Marixanthomonas spongiae TaxID=2174845 RepID=A0A2U0I8C7_9FLAO|nr:DUF488 domain-containing protein [Marixanthomonas spongiae]PVW17324.1 DUF488 domain-containing protein [Marixanthomonas spongiae]
MKIQIKRIYEDAANRDGHRVLVDRVWPRGVSKEDARLDDWNKEIAPTSDLRKWFDHKEERFSEFKKKYKKELSNHTEDLKEIAEIAKEKQVTLLFGAKDEEHNQAVVLKEYLESNF